MNLHDIIGEIPKPFWLDSIDFLVGNYPAYELSKTESDHVIGQLEYWLNQGKPRRAANWMMIGLFFDEGGSLVKIRRRGYLRPSKYEFRASCISSTLKRLLNSQLSLSDDTQLYLESIINLCKLSQDINKKMRVIISNLRRGREFLFWKLTAAVDLNFMIQATRGVEPNKLIPADNITFYAPEDLAEALSYIGYLFYSKVGPTRGAFRYFNISRNKIESLLVMSAQIKAFQEFEIFVDAFDYRLGLDDVEKIATLTAPTKEFESALRIGYINSISEKSIFQQRNSSESDFSLRNAGKAFYDAVKDEFVQFRTEPYPRYAFRVIVEGPLTKIIHEESLFAEEYLALSHASKEWLVSVEELCQFELHEGLTMWDIIKIQRLFNFFRWYVVSHLEPRLGAEPEIILQSLAPAFSQDDLTQLLKMAIGDKAQNGIKFLTWSPESPRVLDLQYQPLLPLGGHILIPFNILANSDLLRNSLQLSRRRFYEDGTVDPSVELMENAFKSRTSETVRNITYNWKEYSGEVDILALIDGILFIVECKNSLGPGTIYESRTSFDYIEKASLQLDRFCEAFSFPQFRKYLSRRIGWQIEESHKPVTCIAMVNRMFAGLRMHNHAVRGSFEIINQLESGVITMGEERLCLWQGDSFTGEDLRRYIEDDISYIPLWESIQDVKHVFPFGDYDLEYHTHYLDLKMVADKFGFTKTAEEIGCWLSA